MRTSCMDGVQPGFPVPGHALKDVVVLFGHLVHLVGAEDVAESDVAVLGVKLLVLGG